MYLSRAGALVDLASDGLEGVALLVPCLVAGLKEGRLGFPKLKKYKGDRAEEAGNQWPVVGTDTLDRFNMSWNPHMDYVEIQIWGKIDLDDVAIFEYRDVPPTGRFLAELNERGIEIRQSRQ